MGGISDRTVYFLLINWKFDAFWFKVIEIIILG